MKFTSAKGPLSSIEDADALIIGVGSGHELDAIGQEVNDLLSGQLLQALGDTGFKGTAGQTTVIPTFGVFPINRVVVTSTGEPTGRSFESIRQSWAVAARVARDAGARIIVSAPAPTVDDDVRRSHQAAAEGMSMACYRFLNYRTQDLPSTRIDEVRFLNTDDAAMDGLRIGEISGRAVAVARDLGNQSGQDLFPERLAGLAWEIADSNGLACSIFDANALAEMGAGAILGVAQGSAREPRLIHLTYKPEGQAKGSIGFVGKGITFDSGGLSLKTADGMIQMKIDMGGAAAVIAAMQAIAELQPPYEVHGVIAAAENMPSGTSFRPGDVLKTMSGKTIEVVNTDAEGRLVLADALTYTARQGVDSMIDLATLTGASVVAVGDDAASVFGTDKELIDNILEAAQTSGEKMWHMPLWSDYRSRFNSAVADMKNGGGRAGGSIIAALILKEFTEDVAWAHLDIAGAAWSGKESGYASEGASGFGVRTLLQFLEERSHTS